MTYTALVLIALAAVAAFDLLALRTRLLLTKTFWLSYAIILCFQLLVNGILTGRHIVRYSPADITGLRLAYAPVEDIGFGFAMTLLTLAMWARLRGIGRRR